MKNRFLAAALCALLVLCLLPGTALAAAASAVTVCGVTLSNGEHLVQGGTTAQTGALPTDNYASFAVENGVATLTLKNFTGSNTKTTGNLADNTGIYADGDLTIRLIGTSDISSSNGCGVWCTTGHLTMIGDGRQASTLTATGSQNGAGISAGNGGTITDVTVTATSPGWYGITFSGAPFTITGSTVTATTNAAIAINGYSDCTISASHVTATRNWGMGFGTGCMFIRSAFTVKDASTVAATCSGGSGYGVWTSDELRVSGGSSLTGTASGNDAFGVRSNSTITVSDAGSKVRGVSSGTGSAGIVAANGITGPVTEPTGGVIGVHVFGRTNLSTVLTDATPPEPALSATLSYPAAPDGADVPKTGDGSTPLLWLGLMLLAGAGLAVSAAHRRRKRCGN